MELDRESIGLTVENQGAIAEIESRGWFVDGQDIARFSLAYAVRAKVPDGGSTGTETRWAAGNFDKTGEIRALLVALYPDCPTPVKLMEHLVNVGMSMILARLSSSQAIGPADLMD